MQSTGPHPQVKQGNGKEDREEYSGTGHGLVIAKVQRGQTCVRGRCKHGRNESPFAMAIVFIAFYLHD